MSTTTAPIRHAIQLLFGLPVVLFRLCSSLFSRSCVFVPRGPYRDGYSIHYRHVVSMQFRIFFEKFCRTREMPPFPGAVFVASDAEPASFFDCHCHFPQLCKFPRVHRNESAGADGCPAVVFSPQDRSAHPPKLNDKLVFRAIAETGCVDPCCTAWHEATGIGKYTVISSKDWFCSRHLYAPG